MTPPEPKKYLLIHGAYHGAWCWNEVKKDLEKKSEYTRSLLANLDVVPFHKKHEILEGPRNKKNISSFKRS